MAFNLTNKVVSKSEESNFERKLENVKFLLLPNPDILFRTLIQK